MDRQTERLDFNLTARTNPFASTNGPKEALGMAEANNTSGKLYTLTEVSKRTKISMPTLQRYKKMFNDRIPSSGDGRSQRYPEAAIEIFNQLKTENSKKPRPSA